MMGQTGDIGRWAAVMLAAVGCATPAAAARTPRIPADAPMCARPGQPSLFLSPMGEPFRAPPGAAYPAAAWFAGADLNHDGFVDRAEMAADAARFFATLDRNHDSRLTPDEIGRYEHEVAPEIAIYQDRAPARGQQERTAIDGRRMPVRTQRLAAGESDYGGAMGAGRYAWLNIPQPVVSADVDMNRAVDAREFAGAAARRFDLLDPRGSGRLRLADLPRTPAEQAISGPCHPLPTRPPERPQ